MVVRTDGCRGINSFRTVMMMRWRACGEDREKGDEH